MVNGSVFALNDEGEWLRYAGYALARRGAEAMTYQVTLDEVLTADGYPLGHGPGTGPRDDRHRRSKTASINDRHPVDHLPCDHAAVVVTFTI